MGGEGQDFRIIEAGEPGSRGGSEVDFRETPDDSRNDDLIKVRVRLKTDRHQRARGVRFFASPNFW